jgi:hypothetical protein
VSTLRAGTHARKSMDWEQEKTGSHPKTVWAESH